MKPSARNLQLDVLRGVAILLVIGRHLELPRPEGLLGLVANAWFQIGWLGVDLFFVLSGFLIGGLLVTEFGQHGHIDIPRFLIRRGLKIYPAYFVFIAYLILMPAAKAAAKGGSVWKALGEQWQLYWPNLLFVQNYVGTNPAGHTWSLAVEEHFYLALPLGLVALAVRKRMRMLVPLCLLVAPALVGIARAISVATGDPFSAKMSATHLRLDALLFGVGIRALAQFYPDQFAAFRAWRGWLLAVGVLLWSVNLFVEPQSAAIRILGLAGTYLGSAAFLVAVFHTHEADFGGWRGLVGGAARALARVGTFSYAIYLWHVTVLGIVGRVVGGRMLAWNSGTNSQLVWALTTAIAATGAIAAGVIATRVVEWPVLKVRDQFFPSRSGSLPAPEAAKVAAG